MGMIGTAWATTIHKTTFPSRRTNAANHVTVVTGDLSIEFKKEAVPATFGNCFFFYISNQKLRIAASKLFAGK